MGGYKWWAVPLHWTLSDLLVYHFHDAEINQDVSCQIKKKSKALCDLFRFLLKGGGANIKVLNSLPEGYSFVHKQPLIYTFISFLFL